MPHTRLDPLLRHVLAEVADASQTVTAGNGETATVSPSAARKLVDRLRVVCSMHEDGALNDGQLVAAVNLLSQGCADTSVLHERLSAAKQLVDSRPPMSAADKKALDEIVDQL